MSKKIHPNQPGFFTNIQCVGVGKKPCKQNKGKAKYVKKNLFETYPKANRCYKCHEEHIGRGDHGTEEEAAFKRESRKKAKQQPAAT